MSSAAQTPPHDTRALGLEPGDPVCGRLKTLLSFDDGQVPGEDLPTHVIVSQRTFFRVTEVDPVGETVVLDGWIRLAWDTLRLIFRPAPFAEKGLA